MASRTGGQEAGQGLLGADARFRATGTKDVLLALHDSTGATVSTAWLDTIHGAEGVQLGTNQAGAVFCIVCTVDDSTGQSYVVRFVDTDADGMPDQASRTTIASEVDTTLCRCALDAASGTLFVIEGSGPTVLRYVDLDGDLMPDGPSSVFFSMSTLGDDEFAPTDIQASSTSACVVFGAELVTDYLGRDREVHLSDDDANGVAEVYTDGTEANPQTVFVGRLFSGETTAEVFSDRTGNFEILSSVDSTVLATFGSAKGAQTITLNRSIQIDEVLELHDADTSTLLSEMHATAGNGKFILGVELLSGRLRDGAQFTIAGRNLDGTEVVDVRLSAGTGNTWNTCLVTQSTSTLLTVTMPNLSLTKEVDHVFRVRTSAGAELYMKRHKVWP